MNLDNNMRKKRMPGRPELPEDEKRRAISIKLHPKLIKSIKEQPENLTLFIEKSVREELRRRVDKK